MNGETLFELVADPTSVSLYVLDEDEPVNAAAMTAKLSINTGAKRTDVTMAAAKGNQFVAKGLKLGKGANVGALVIDKTTPSGFGTTFIIN